VASLGVPDLLPFFTKLAEQRAPLGWTPTNFDAVARACGVLLSDLFNATTGDVIHVDGGAHAVGAELPHRSSDHLVPVGS
jgi:enoyl-[acyl-carrier-protein] reductase (NADH)